jgi:hypothetical protein
MKTSDEMRVSMRAPRCQQRILTDFGMQVSQLRTHSVEVCGASSRFSLDLAGDVRQRNTEERHLVCDYLEVNFLRTSSVH